jgi:hypothetical protein
MSTGALNTERTTIGVDAGYGSGIYSQDLDVSLDIPAMSQAGTYTATLVVATSVAP